MLRVGLHEAFGRDGKSSNTGFHISGTARPQIPISDGWAKRWVSPVGLIASRYDIRVTREANHRISATTTCP